jgi:hypothetical protein
MVCRIGDSATEASEAEICAGRLAMLSLPLDFALLQLLLLLLLLVLPAGLELRPFLLAGDGVLPVTLLNGYPYLEIVFGSLSDSISSYVSKWVRMLNKALVCSCVRVGDGSWAAMTMRDGQRGKGGMKSGMTVEGVMVG